MDTNIEQFHELVRRFDKLEAALLERERYGQAETLAIRKDIDHLQIRMRDVEISQAKLLALVTGGGGIGGTIAGLIILGGKALGWF